MSERRYNTLFYSTLWRSKIWYDVFGYRRNSFKKAATLLNKLRANLNDLGALQDLQELLISEIVLAEGRIRDAKAKSKLNADENPNKFSDRAKSFQKVIFFWRAFGDAIAFLYLDRFALKHVYYNTHNYNVRQDAGFISGSSGFKREIKIFKGLLEAGYPCLLTDLTNTIRYGDICVLFGPDPMLIEVKSSKTKSRRISRQIKNLEKLSEFYRTDQSDDFRGGPGVRRVESQTEPEIFEAEFNQCINKAYDNGYAIISPEEGVYYIAIRNYAVPVKEIFKQVNLNKPLVVFLNTLKSDQSWAPYYPFTLLIESDKALYDFILGRLFIIVIMDTEVMRKRVIEVGYTPEIVPESDYPIRVKKNGAEGEARISAHILLRAALEAVSLKWIIHSALEGFERNQAIMRREFE